jgi:hypothetical protein
MLSFSVSSDDQEGIHQVLSHSPHREGAVDTQLRGRAST